MKADKLVAMLRDVDTMDAQELRTLSDAVKARWNELRNEASNEFKHGDLVSFDGGRRYGLVFGKIVGSTKKSFIVEATYGKRWRVSPTLLAHRKPAIGEKV